MYITLRSARVVQNHETSERGVSRSTKKKAFFLPPPCGVPNVRAVECSGLMGRTTKDMGQYNPDPNTLSFRFLLYILPIIPPPSPTTPGELCAWTPFPRRSTFPRS